MKIPRRIVASLCGLLLAAACTRFIGTAPGPAQPQPTESTVILPEAGNPTLASTPTIAPLLLPPEGRRATVSEIVNIVEARPFPEALFEPVQDGAVIGLGGQVRTGANSRARVDLYDGLIVRLGADTVFTVEAITPDVETPVTLVSLDLGHLWASVPVGWLQVNTPIGPVSIKGSYAVLDFNPGDPNNAVDDTLIIDCIQGACVAKPLSGEVSAFGLERVTLAQSGGQIVREPLTPADLEDFVALNPEAFAALVATPIAPDTPTPAPPTAEAGVPASDTPSPTTEPTLTPTSAAATTVGGVAVLGKHIVRAGETLFCIGRAYGVLPGAIAEANRLNPNATLLQNKELLIPAVQWFSIPRGPVCVPQFASPYPPGPGGPAPTSRPPTFPTAAPTGSPPTSTSAPPPTLAFTGTPACNPPEVYDPAMDRCRIP